MLLQNTDAFERVIAGNKQFIERITTTDPALLPTLAKGQSPEVLWIGCADSRVPETTICASKPGEIFVHRNIANVVHSHDLNSASVIEYAVGALKVQKVVVCGHTKCGGANAALGDGDLGDALNSWLSPVRELRRRHQDVLNGLESEDERVTRLAELNVRKSIEALKRNATVAAAVRERGLTLHGVIYDIEAGELRVIHDERAEKADKEASGGQQPAAPAVLAGGPVKAPEVVTEAHGHGEHHAHNGKKSEDTGQPVVRRTDGVEEQPLAVRPVELTGNAHPKAADNPALWNAQRDVPAATAGTHRWLRNH